MPRGEAAAGRATLGELLTPAAPSTAVTAPANAASAPSGTGRASPVREP